MNNRVCPLLGFVGYSGSGKTTLLTQLIQILRDRGYRLGVIKHAHHQFDIDHPGKDSYELRKAGASQMLVASQQRWAMISETPEDTADPDLMALLEKLDTDTLDLVIVEGFKHAEYPKLEVYRPVLSHSPLFPEDDNILGVITELPSDLDTPLPLLDINNPQKLADFVETFIQQTT